VAYGRPSVRQIAGDLEWFACRFAEDFVAPNRRTAGLHQVTATMRLWGDGGFWNDAIFGCWMSDFRFEAPEDLLLKSLK
jgi:hypothetical protein